MSVVTDAVAAAPAAAKKLTFGWAMIWLAVGLVLFSLLRIVTGADDLDSSGTLRATLVAAVPIAWGWGLGWTDVHLLAASLLSHCRLWTLDSRLRGAASDLGLN